MYGGVIDPTTNALTNRPALISAFQSKIAAFACNYLTSRVRDRHISYDTAMQATRHVTPASAEVATAFVDALLDSHRTGGPIPGTHVPAHRPGWCRYMRTTGPGGWLSRWPGRASGGWNIPVTVHGLLTRGDPGGSEDLRCRHVDELYKRGTFRGLLGFCGSILLSAQLR